MTIEVREPALQIMVFVPLDSNTAKKGRGIPQAWDAASKLGITEPATEFDQPADLPDTFPEDDVWFRVVAAKAGADGRDSAVAFIAHDVAAVMIRLRWRKDTDGADAWPELSSAWREAAPHADLTGILGAAYVFTGSANEPSLSLATGAEDMARKVSAGHAGSGLEASDVVEPGIALWDMEMPAGRTIVALAGEETPSCLAEWCWLSSNSDDVGKLVRYFMHASKIRYEIGMFRSEIGDLRSRERELDEGLAELFALHERFEESSTGAGELIDAQSRLSRAQGDAAGLLISITRLRDLRQTVQIGIHNLRAHEPTRMAGAPPTMSPFARDLELAEWLDGRVSTEITYLQSSRERIAEAQALTDLRMKQLQASHAQRANWLSVLQTSLVASLLGVFTVSSALGAPVAVPWELRVSLTVFIVGLAMVLPPLAARWNHGYRWPELAAAALVGTAAGCAAVAAMASIGKPPMPSPPDITLTWSSMLVAAGVGAALFGGGAYLANRRKP
ncbi:CATRA conflict system CASPASE/TPR repeat-associated protein [Mycolicibacterium stellerae]|uniref:CATRA conflict system CASPASE/TPR repeat-associated protein n=1 Tax=Mycolicibacterium stellerae TaxID=2358193 RepID=UPI000F0BDA01|nr:CATRA conflict system CASPASE/TPR repeat-associated protein [Mycolicibacterium stellerae]